MLFIVLLARGGNRNVCSSNTVGLQGSEVICRWIDDITEVSLCGAKNKLLFSFLLRSDSVKMLNIVFLSVFHQFFT